LARTKQLDGNTSDEPVSWWVIPGVD